MSAPQRIVCLHGLYQSGEVFRRKIPAIQAALRNEAELLFVTAPHQCVPPALQGKGKLRTRNSKDRPSNSPSAHYGWWKHLPNSPDDEAIQSRQRQLEASLAALRSALEGHQVDGVLGFSQGATLASLLCTDMGARLAKWRPRYAVIITGRCSVLRPEWYEAADQSIPSLHVWGSQDQVVAPQLSNTLAQCFHQPEVLTHDRGHVPPVGEHLIAQMSDFVAKQRLC